MCNNCCTVPFYFTLLTSGSEYFSTLRTTHFQSQTHYLIVACSRYSRVSGCFLFGCLSSRVLYVYGFASTILTFYSETCSSSHQLVTI